MADRTIATITGTMLAPGVSGNGRLYTPEAVKKAVQRMQGRLSDPTALPVVMRSHHDAGDDSTRIVGRLTSVKLDDTGAVKYSANLYDTASARDIAALVTGKNPALRSVSIHGWWLGPVKRVQHDGETVETADDLEVNAVDFTANPGVRQALLDLPSVATTESITERTPIAESVDATVTAVTDPAPEPSVIEAKDPQKPYGNVQYADPGYQADKKKRYPLDTDDHIRSAWSYINQKGNAAQYTAKQLARITSRIKAAMKRIGAKVSDESVSATVFGEIREFAQGPSGQSGFCIDAFNGPVSVTVRSCDIDPSGLRVVAAAAMSAAVDALQALDPDMDADIDVPGNPADDTDGDMGKGKGKKAKETASDTPWDGEPFLLPDGENAVRRRGDTRTVTTEAGLPPKEIYEITTGGTAMPTHGQLQTIVRNCELAKEAEGAPSVTEGDAEISAPTTETTPNAGVSTNTEEVPAVSEATQDKAAESTAAPTGRTLSDEDIAALGALFAGAVKEAVASVAPVAETAKPKKAKTAPVETSESAPAAPTAESTPKAERKARKALKETVDGVKAELEESFASRLTEALTKQRDELREELRGEVSRKGYRVHESDTDVEKEPTGEDVWNNRSKIFDQILPGGPVQPVQTADAA